MSLLGRSETITGLFRVWSLYHAETRGQLKSSHLKAALSQSDKTLAPKVAAVGDINEKYSFPNCFRYFIHSMLG